MRQKIERRPANAELLTLLTGPRWAIGPRDLALLGTRAGELAESGRGRGTSLSLDEELARAHPYSGDRLHLEMTNRVLRTEE